MDKILQLDNVNAVQIAGPTASGKSALAIKFAQMHNGEIINADSMQVYKILNVLTARPQPSELNAAPHHLYGHLQPGTEYSTGHWLKDVEDKLKDVRSRGKLPIFVGGTGLYFKALNGGLSIMPDIDENIRNYWRNELEEKGPEYLHKILQRKDPIVAAELKPADRQRITRALEIIDATGQSIRDLQNATGKMIIDPKQSKNIILLPDRPILIQRIEKRFHEMVEMGALAEVQSLLDMEINEAHTSMKAIGVREITAYLNDEIPLKRAIELSIIATRQYAKRQSTWFRNQLKENWTIINNLKSIA